MNAMLAVWRAHLLSIRNTGRDDARMRSAAIILLLIDCALGLWSGQQLLVRVAQWQAAGPVAVENGLWSLCLLAWSGIAAVTLLETVRLGLDDDTTLLLFTLPIAPATRFRAEYGLFFLRRLWNWLLLEVGITGTALVMRLGWQALGWLLLLQLGTACVVWLSLTLVLLFIRAVVPRRSGWKRLLSPGLPGVGIAMCSLCAFLLVAAMRALSFWLRPELASGLLALLLVVAVGPLAQPIGRLYEAAFSAFQARARRSRAWHVPGTRVLARWLARGHGLSGAHLYKGWLNQSRNAITWLRVLLVIVLLAFFPAVRTLLSAYSVPDMLIVAGYAAGLAVLSIGEQSTGAISSEGNRLALYLTAPFSPARILRTRFLNLCLPVLIGGLAIGALLAWKAGLPLNQTGFVLVGVVLVVVGCIALPIWGSVWDEDLSLPVEGAVQAMLQEEVPLTPRRMVLLNLTLLLFAAMCLLAWKLPPPLALASLSLLDVLIVFGAWHLAQVGMRRLLRA